MKRFEGQIVLITGAAGNLGSCAANQFMREGAHVVLTDHRKGRLGDMFPGLEEDPKHFLLDHVDLTDLASLQKGLETALQRFNHIDVLINTVGGFLMGSPVHQTTSREWEKMINLNTLPILNTARAVVPIMLEAGKGSIVHVGARTSLEGKAKMGAYSASKAALLSLTESMAAELKNQGIRVNCILPGTIDTPENREAMPGANTNRWVKPQSLVEVMMFLASDAARDIHGAAIPVFGS